MIKDEKTGDFALSKRFLGLIFVSLGLLAILGSFLNDLIGGGRFAGIGPTQRVAILVAGLVILVGLSLIPLGKRPA
ncbi:MAG: hypothetical protein KDE59_01220 [Anaerolineales bacterium]|nr:hypothetical protein [Anaerolineales bacterium]MCA9982874.1 hypothetical protein [Anaerolineales bacterium]MCB0014122.1 hypothetical protein [Anaerolineales bacterium]MCB0026421.1 hypothetical protein [Anaerolineales bacterium]